MGYFLNILILGSIFAILAVSLNIACGYAGILSLAQAVFYGIGAYSMALLTVHWSFPFWVSFLVGGTLAALCGLLLGVPTLRLKGDYFLMATLGFGEIFTNSLVNLDSLTGGPRGVTGIPPASFLGWRFDSDSTFLLLLWIILGLCLISAYFIKNSPLGQILFGIAEDEEAVAALGRNPASFKILSLVLSAFWAGLAGGLYACYLGFINPNLFTINESILIFTMMLLGGMRSVRGAVLGAFVLVAMPEAMRFLGFPNSIAAVSRQIIYGALLILIMYFRPQGLLGAVKLR